MSSRLKYVVVMTSTCLVAMLMAGAVVGRSASPEDAYRHLAVYTEVLSRIKSDYVEEPDMKSVTLGAVNGLLEAIDPYASFLSAEQYKTYLKAKDTAKGGVGLILSKRFGYIGIVDAIPGSPADKAGLSTGDMIETVTGVSTRDMPLAYAEVLLNGAPGTTVELAVLRLRRSSEAQKVTLTRAEVKYPPVAARMLEPGIGQIEVASLEAGKTKQVAEAIASLEKQGAKKLVLDLRHAAYGAPQEGAALANLFLDKGLITYLQGQKVSRQNFEADPAKAVYRDPLVVLTNRGTAGGAEVAAAALADSKRATLVGERTYGDAALRRAITMDDGSAVILSVAKYYSPSGKAIQDNAVTPGVPVLDSEPAAEIDEDAPGKPETPEPPRKLEDDAALKKAIEVLTKGVPPAEERKTQAQGPDSRTLSPRGPLGQPRLPR
ncbi:MAG: PDZ domain-containing protein [Acidobacteria bacterium]|nr:PDZ domain-containing protein [Acidobacteriota bacterium]